MLILVGRLSALGWRSECSSPDLPEILRFGSLLLFFGVLWKFQGSSILRSGPVHGCSNGRGQFSLLLVHDISTWMEPSDGSNWGGPDRASAMRVMPPGEEQQEQKEPQNFRNNQWEVFRSRVRKHVLRITLKRENASRTRYCAW